jgi:hypothetical protein
VDISEEAKTKSEVSMTATENSLNSLTKKKAITSAPASPLRLSDNHTLRKKYSYSSLSENNSNRNHQPITTKTKSAKLSIPKELNNDRLIATTTPLKTNSTPALVAVNKAADQKRQLQNQTKITSIDRKSTLVKERIKIVTSKVDRPTNPTTARNLQTPSRYLRGEPRANETRRIAADKRKDYLAAGVPWNPDDASHFSAAKKKALQNNPPIPVATSPKTNQKFQPLTSENVRQPNTSWNLRNSPSSDLNNISNTSVVRSANYSASGSVKNTDSQSYTLVMRSNGQWNTADDRLDMEQQAFPGISTPDTGWQVVDRKQGIEILREPSKIIKSGDLASKVSGDGLADLAIFKKPQNHRYDVSFQKNVDGRRRAVIQAATSAPSLYERQVATQSVYVNKSGEIQLESNKHRSSSGHFQSVDQSWFGAKPPS